MWDVDNAKCYLTVIVQELTDRLEGMKVAHQDEKQDYERQLSELRAEYTKTKDELDGEIMTVLTNKNTVLTNDRWDHGIDQEAGLLGGIPSAEGAADEQVWEAGGIDQSEHNSQLLYWPITFQTESKEKMEDYEKRLYDLEKSHIREQDR